VWSQDVQKNPLQTILKQLGRLDEESVLRRETACGYDNQPANDYPGRLLDRVNLGDSLLAQGKYDEALDIGLSVEKDALLRLGPYHATCLSAKKLIVEAYDAKGELKLSSEINQDLIRSRRQSSVADHVVWIEEMSILGVQYYRLGALDMAHKCHESVMFSIKKDKKAAIPAATAINNHATKLLRRGQVEGGITILEHLLARPKISWVMRTKKQWQSRAI
jgi:tetratricopeptide (TPR) repeat protein